MTSSPQLELGALGNGGTASSTVARRRMWFLDNHHHRERSLTSATGRPGFGTAHIRDPDKTALSASIDALVPRPWVSPSTSSRIAQSADGSGSICLVRSPFLRLSPFIRGGVLDRLVILGHASSTYYLSPTAPYTPVFFLIYKFAISPTGAVEEDELYSSPRGRPNASQGTRVMTKKGRISFCTLHQRKADRRGVPGSQRENDIGKTSRSGSANRKHQSR